MSTSPPGLPGHAGGTALSPLCPQIREGGGQRAAGSPRSHCTWVKVPLLEDVAALSCSAVRHGNAVTLQPGTGNPWGGAAESAHHLHPLHHHHNPQARFPLATSHSAAPALGRDPTAEGPGDQLKCWHVPPRSICPPHGTHPAPGHLVMQSESNPSMRVGTWGTHITVVVSPNQPIPAWGSLASPWS